MDAWQITKQKVAEYQTEFLEQLNALEVDAHWFRRVFHTFAASFVFYYLLPDEYGITLLKNSILILVVIGMVGIEYRRLKGEIDHERFFGLRNYEKGRPASYLYFAIAVVLLFLFFPQQIAIPCILCAAFTDPIIGEARYYFGKKKAYLIGFLVSLCIFLVIWNQAEWWILVLVSVVGASGALLGEAKKLRLVDDDFLIQILPAIFIVVLWQIGLTMGVNILPPESIIPLQM